MSTILWALNREEDIHKVNELLVSQLLTFTGPSMVLYVLRRDLRCSWMHGEPHQPEGQSLHSGSVWKADRLNVLSQFLLASSDTLQHVEPPQVSEIQLRRQGESLEWDAPPFSAQGSPDKGPTTSFSSPVFSTQDTKWDAETMAKGSAGALPSNIKGLESLTAFLRAWSTSGTRDFFSCGMTYSSQAERLFSKPLITKNVFLSAMPEEKQNYLSILFTQNTIIKFWLFEEQSKRMKSKK